MPSSRAMEPYSFTKRGPSVPREVKPFLDSQVEATTKPTLPTKLLPQPPTKHTQWWKLEILWALVMAASLIALIVFLRIVDGQQARTWGFITPNTVVAILTTIMSSSMTAIISASISQGLWNWFTESPTSYRTYRPRPLKDLELFDAASRGPAGGLQLLWRLRGSHLATIGPLLVVLNLGLGAFTQQLVANKVYNIPTGIAPELPRTERFKANFGDLPRSPTLGAPDIPTKAAIYNAAVGRDIADLTPTCPSGNCTYPLTPTLAMCGECTDISGALNYTGSCNVSSYPYACSSHLPNNASLTYDDEHADANSWAIFNITPVDDVTFNPLVYNDSDKLYATVFDAIGVPPKLAFQWFTPGVNTNDSVMPPMQAHECALWWCIQSYNSSVIDAVAHKTLVQTWSETRDGFNFTNIPSSMNTDAEASYGLDDEDKEGMETALRSISLGPGQAIVQYLDDGALVAFGTEDTRQQYSISGDIIEGAWQGSKNFHDANGTGWIDTLARSLSNSIAATNLTRDSTAYQGTSWAPASFVVVQWSYIAFPVALAALSLFYFVLTTVATRRKAIYPWRVGLLALLLMRVDEDLQDEAARQRALDRPSGLDAIREEELRLRRGDDGGWAFERRSKVTQLDKVTPPRGGRVTIDSNEAERGSCRSITRD